MKYYLIEYQDADGNIRCAMADETTTVEGIVRMAEMYFLEEQFRTVSYSLKQVG